MNESDQAKGKPHPPHGKTLDGPAITLPPFDGDQSPVSEGSYPALLDIRRSVRVYDESAPMTQEQLAFILYSAQGIQGCRGKDEAFTLRPVPSGGSRHPFETYVAVANVEGLKEGIYYYAPTANAGEKKVSLIFMRPFENRKELTGKMLCGQNWATNASAVLFITCVPYRSEWRYREHSHRVMLIDLGHAGQNIMLSAACTGLGSCCMAAYDQDLCDEVLGADGKDEYTVYAVAVGTMKSK